MSSFAVPGSAGADAAGGRSGTADALGDGRASPHEHREHDGHDGHDGQNGHDAQNGHDDQRHEDAPLLTAYAEGAELEAGPTADGEAAFQQTKSVWFLAVLTLGIGGLQIAWSVELSNGSPYLLSLGLSKSLMALVWIAGPLTGTLVQPYVGMLSDGCRVSWGKRKPFMLGGAAATMVSLMCLAWTRDMVAGTLSAVFGADPQSGGVRTAVIVVAVLWVYVLDFSINTVQAAIRAFIVDCAPAHQQEAANAMASRMTGIGNIIGYVAGYLNLPTLVPWLGNTQFKDLCAIATCALGATVLLSCLLVHERDPRLDGPPPASTARPGVLAFFRQILVSIRRLPPQISKVCAVQFCAWVGFFPMLFYTSSYIGEIYVEPFLQANPHMTPEELDRLYEQATRVGTFALLVYSITSLCTNVFLPFLIAPTYDSRPADADGADRAAPLPKSWLDYLVVPGFTLRRAWMLSLLLFSGSMFCTVLVRSVAAATTLIALVGITWALTLWAPWAIISAEISQRDARIRARKRARLDDDGGGASGDSGYSGDSDGSLAGVDEGEVDQAGVILGIHNMAIAAPQIFATVGSSIVFKFLQKPRGTPGDHSIAVVMALGGITVLAAAYLVHRIEDEPAAALAGAGIYAGLPSDVADTESVYEEGERLSRESQDRAALARGLSFGAGLEY